MATQDFSKSAAMVLKTMKALADHTLTGLSVSELAKKLDTSKPNTSRYLNALVSEELARKLASGRYALSGSMIEIAQKTAADLIKNKAEIEDMLQRIASIGVNND